MSKGKSRRQRPFQATFVNSTIGTGGSVLRTCGRQASGAGGPVGYLVLGGYIFPVYWIKGLGERTFRTCNFRGACKRAGIGNWRGPDVSLQTPYRTGRACLSLLVGLINRLDDDGREHGPVAPSRSTGQSPTNTSVCFIGRGTV